MLHPNSHYCRAHYQRVLPELSYDPHLTDEETRAQSSYLKCKGQSKAAIPGRLTQGLCSETQGHGASPLLWKIRFKLQGMTSVTFGNIGNAEYIKMSDRITRDMEIYYNCY